jgi:hypothetical protein
MPAPKRLVWGILGTAALLTAVVMLTTFRQTHPRSVQRAVLPVDYVPRPKEADRLYASNPKAAAPKYREFVAKYASAKDPVLQDQVGTARLKLGFLAARQKDWRGARQAFLEAGSQTTGTGRTGDFGTVNEQGAYEAIVCLEASGHKEEARERYEGFIRNRPLSPLCMACYRRLKRLSGGRSTPALEKLIESATQRQDANSRFEASVCGPKAISHLIDIGALNAGNRPHDYKSVAKLCHTRDSGTTIAGMVEGLKALGACPSAYRVNRQDLVELKTPAILLWGDHYVTLLKVSDRTMRVYDTLSRSEQEYPIPDREDPDFYVNAVLINAPSPAQRP